MNKGILFDKDGTLFEFGSLWTQATTEFLATLVARTTDAKAMLHALGMVDGQLQGNSILTSGTPKDLGEVLAAHGAFDTATAAEQYATDYFYQFLISHLDNVHPIGDLKGLLQHLHDTGYYLGVITSDEKQSTMTTLTHAGVAHLFDFIGTADDYPTKPNPSALYAFCKQTGVTLTDAIMVGDSIMDIELGLQSHAGVAVLSGTGVQRDFEGLTPYIYNDIHAIPYAEILPLT